MKIYLILLGLMICHNKIDAQNSRPKQLREILRMSKPQYSPFSDSLKGYNHQQQFIQHDSTKNRDQKHALLLTLWENRKKYIQNTLSPSQRILFKQYSDSMAMSSPNQTPSQNAHDRMRNKGLTVIEH